MKEACPICTGKGLDIELAMRNIIEKHRLDVQATEEALCRKAVELGEGLSAVAVCSRCNGKTRITFGFDGITVEAPVYDELAEMIAACYNPNKQFGNGTRQFGRIELGGGRFAVGELCGDAHMDIMCNSPYNVHRLAAGLDRFAIKLREESIPFGVIVTSDSTRTRWYIEHVAANAYQLAQFIAAGLSPIRLPDNRIVCKYGVVLKKRADLVVNEDEPEVMDVQPFAVKLMENGTAFTINSGGGDLVKETLWSVDRTCNPQPLVP